MIVADTGVVLALIDRNERHHEVLRDLYEKTADEWLLPWAILPEIDYLLATHVSAAAQEAFLEDLADGGFNVAWGDDADLLQAHGIVKAHRALRLGLVDAVVLATARRLKARAIATLDLRHFGAISGTTPLYPRDL